MSSLSNITAGPALFLTFCQFYNTLDMYEIVENVDPNFFLKKHNMDLATHPDAWEVVAKEVKTVMELMSGMEPVEEGYRDIKVMETV